MKDASMKNAKIFVIIVTTTFLMFSCQLDASKHNTEFGICTVHYNSIDEYYKTCTDTVRGNPLMSFYFLHNPYRLNENNIISIYLNYKVVYRGPFKQLIELKGDVNDLFDSYSCSTMIFSLEILTDKTKKTIWKREFDTKTVFSWNEKYKIVYCVFCPTNEEVEKVYFIPQQEKMI